jgi:curved DNA-binding protein CbpA
VRTDLYEALGVARDAAPDEVRRAYRRAAKRAHPDGGGTVESFALVRTAVEVLTDEARRARYDRTGEVGERPVDQSESLAMTVAMNALDAVLGHILRRGGDPASYDVIADARTHLRKCLLDAETKIEGMLAEAGAIRKLSGRFRAKKGRANRLGAMFVARAVEVERGAARGREEWTNIKRALAILDEHVFDVDVMRAQSAAVGSLFMSRFG